MLKKNSTFFLFLCFLTGGLIAQDLDKLRGPLSPSRFPAQELQAQNIHTISIEMTSGPLRDSIPRINIGNKYPKPKIAAVLGFDELGRLVFYGSDNVGDWRDSLPSSMASMRAYTWNSPNIHCIYIRYDRKTGKKNTQKIIYTAYKDGFLVEQNINDNYHSPSPHSLFPQDVDQPIRYDSSFHNKSFREQDVLLSVYQHKFQQDSIFERLWVYQPNDSMRTDTIRRYRTFDQNGQLIRERAAIDFQGRTDSSRHLYWYNKAGQVTKHQSSMDRGSGNIASFSYNRDGQLLEIKIEDSIGPLESTTLEYLDGLPQKASTEDFLSERTYTWTYSYNPKLPAIKKMTRFKYRKKLRN